MLPADASCSRLCRHPSRTLPRQSRTRRIRRCPALTGPGKSYRFIKETLRDDHLAECLSIREVQGDLSDQRGQRLGFAD